MQPRQSRDTTGEPEIVALYHIYAPDDTLLYIGISKDFGKRWKDHARVQPWWVERRRMTVEWHDSRPEAEDAEEAAIKAELPKYNKAHAVTMQLQPLPRPPVATGDLDGWITPTVAAGLASCSRTTVLDAAERGRLQAQRYPNGYWLVREDQVPAWAATLRRRRTHVALLPRQSEALVALHRQGELPPHPHAITTARALARRGLIEQVTFPRAVLTKEGARVAADLCHEEDAAAVAAGTLASSASIANYLHVEETTLARWRGRRKGPRYRAVDGEIFYDWADVDEWLGQQSSAPKPNVAS